MRRSGVAAAIVAAGLLTASCASDGDGRSGNADDIGQQAETASTTEADAVDEGGAWAIDACSSVLALHETLSGASAEQESGAEAHQLLVDMADHLGERAQAFADVAKSAPDPDQAVVILELAELTTAVSEAYRVVAGRTTPELFETEIPEAVIDDMDRTLTPPTFELVTTLRDLVVSPTYQDLSRTEVQALAEDAVGEVPEGSCSTAAVRLLSLHE